MGRRRWDNRGSNNRGSNNIAIIGAAALLLAAAAVVVMKRGGGVTPTPPAPSQPQVDAPPPAAASRWDQQGFTKLVDDARADYVLFLQAEAAQDADSRRRYYKQARAKLDAFMQQVNALRPEEIEDRGLVERAQQMLSDLAKKSYTAD